MKSKLLDRDYPLSETKMSKDEEKKTSSDSKKATKGSTAGVINTTRSNIRNTAGIINTTRSNIRNLVINKGKEEMKNKGL